MDVPVSPSSFTSLCRLCLEPDQAVISIFKENDNGARELYDKISVCLPVKLDEEDSLPKKICNTCHNSVDFIYNFWQLSSNSEKQLLTMIGNFKSEFHLQESGVETDNSMIIYDTLEVKDVIHEDKELEDDENNADVEIKEVYFGEYLNQCDTIEDENTVLINEDNPIEETVVENNVLNVQPINPIQTLQSNNPEDIQISQIVESSNVSLRAFDEENSIKLKLWDVALPDFFLIPYDYEVETPSIDPNTMVLVDLQKPNTLVPEKNFAYVCNICSTTFDEQLPYLKHYESAHKQFKCPFCVKSFNRRYALENHLFVHSTRRDFPCTMCTVKFKRKYDLKQHIKRMHNTFFDIPIFECAHCSYKTKHKNQMRIHALGHLGISPYVCETCGKTFKTNLDFTVHRNNHLGIKPFQCDICGNHFTRKHYMLKHRKTMHEESYSYQCDVCGRSFSYKTSLNTHLKLHTGENRVQCDICNKIVSGKVALNNHKKIHSDVKEFVCGICGKVYINKYSLQEHVLVHTGSKPFQCLQCDKSFSTRKKLLNHEQIHDPVRSFYFCTLCDKSYLSKYKLSEHLQKRH